MIQVENVTKTFDGEAALRDLSCSFRAGSVSGIVGSNGAGKSTLLRLIAGIYRPDAGEVRLDGTPVHDHPEAMARSFLVADEPYYPAEADLRQMARLYAVYYPGFDGGYFDEMVRGLHLDAGKKLRGFSKGMRRQAAIALGLAAHTDVLMLDETFDGVDPVVRQYIKQLLLTAVADRGVTLLMAGHSLREMADVCDRLTFLHRQGALVIERDVDQLKTQMFKVQVALSGDFDEHSFDACGLHILKYTRFGRVAQLILRGSEEHARKQLGRLEPLLLDVVPLSLEEVFTYELEAAGYRFGEDEEAAGEPAG